MLTDFGYLVPWKGLFGAGAISENETEYLEEENTRLL